MSPIRHSHSGMGAISLPRRKSARVLVVDDNRENAILTRELLHTDGYEVQIAGNAARAEASFARIRPM